MKILILIFLASFSVGAFAQDARVASKTANLREKPTVKAQVVSVLPQGTTLKITDKKGNWYNVRTDKNAGWMHAVTLRFTEKSGLKPVTTSKRETGDVPIKAIFVGELNNPTLTISNNSIRPMELILGNVLYEIEAGAEKTIDLKPGSYEYTATSKGLSSITGVKSFVRKRSYTWAFRLTEPNQKVEY